MNAGKIPPKVTVNRTEHTRDRSTDKSTPVQDQVTITSLPSQTGPKPPLFTMHTVTRPLDAKPGQSVLEKGDTAAEVVSKEVKFESGLTLTEIVGDNKVVVSKGGTLLTELPETTLVLGDSRVVIRNKDMEESITDWGTPNVALPACYAEPMITVKDLLHKVEGVDKHDTYRIAETGEVRATLYHRPSSNSSENITGKLQDGLITGEDRYGAKVSVKPFLTPLDITDPSRMEREEAKRQADFQREVDAEKFFKQFPPQGETYIVSTPGPTNWPPQKYERFSLDDGMF